MDIEADARAALGWAEQHLGRARPPQPTFTAAVQAAQAAPSQQSQSSQQEVQTVTIGQTVHKDVSAAGAAIQRIWQITQQVAANKPLDDLLAAGLEAIGQGVAAEAFEAATDALRGAISRKAGAAGQVAAAADAGVQAARQEQPPASAVPPPSAAPSVLPKVMA